MFNLRSEQYPRANDELEDVLKGLERIEEFLVHGWIAHILNVILENDHQLAAVR